MAAPAWRSDLPDPQASGYELAPTATFTRTDFENGPARQRRTASGVQAVTSLSWNMSGAQARSFRGFYEDDISMGTRAFTMDLWVDTEKVNLTVRFTEPPKQRFLSYDAHEISGNIEILQGLPTS